MQEMQETCVQSLGREEPLEEAMSTHTSTLAWKVPWSEEPGGPQSTGSHRVGHDLVTQHTHTQKPLVGAICYHRHFLPPPNFGLEEHKVTQKGAVASSPASAWLLTSRDSHALPPHRCPDFCPYTACLSHDWLSSS